MITIHSLDEIPECKNEDEEHEFWANHTFSDELMDQAEPFAPDELPPPRAATAPVTILIEEPTLARVKALARRRHTPYKSLLAELVRKGLAEEERQADAQSPVPPAGVSRGASRTI